MPDIYIARSYQHRNAQGISESAPFEVSRAFDAYVLLGEPGSGKTEVFKHEAEACGGHYVKARDITFVQPRDIAGDKLLFVDGLDERRAMGGATHPPLEDIRLQLDRLGRPRFRLSCREADWLGDNDREALEMIAPSRHIEVLHLEPLSEAGIVELLAALNVADPQDFYDRACSHQLDSALSNPNVLRLLATAVGDGPWPISKAQIFERACQELARDTNVVHQTASATPRPARDIIIRTAGYLSAILLLSGRDEVSHVDQITAPNVVPLGDLAAPDLPLAEALASNLFRGARDLTRTYLHRSVAEYLGGMYLASRIEDHRVPAERIVAACVGDDGGIAPDLRGLCAWISAASRTARLTLVDRDPLGIVLYGDVAGFPREDKERIFAALRQEAGRYPGFRSGDWTSAPFGGLSTADMLPYLEAQLRAPISTDGDQVFIDCVLDAIANGERLATLEPLLLQLARNDVLWPMVRKSAMTALEHVVPDSPTLVYLLDEIHAGRVEDRDDELMGYLLTSLYAKRRIPVARILDYLRAPKVDNLIGSYWTFWLPTLVNDTPIAELPALMAEFARRKVALGAFWDNQHIARDLPGEALVRTLKHHGETVSDEQIYEWLGAGLDKYGLDRLDSDDRKFVSAWIEARPARYRDIARRPVEACRTAPDVEMCLRHVRQRLFDAEPPADLAEWYLTLASTETQDNIARYYFAHAVASLHRRDRSEVLSSASLDLLGDWVDRFPKMDPWRAEATSYAIDHWKRDDYQHTKKRKAEASEHKREVVEQFVAAIAEIATGTAAPHLMFQLAQVYVGLRIEGRGGSPKERLEEFFDRDRALVDATLSGLARVPLRNDLPSSDEAIALRLKGKFHLIREAALVGMERRFEGDPNNGLDLPDRTLKALCAYRLTKGLGDSLWYEALARSRPDVVAKVIVDWGLQAMAAKHEQIEGLWSLGHDPDMKAVAAIAVPPLLKDFPPRATVKQVKAWLEPLLRGLLAAVPKPQALEVIEAKLETAVAPHQRIYWLACGLLLDSVTHFKPLKAFIGSSRKRLAELGAFLGRPRDFGETIEHLPDEPLGFLIEFLGPGQSPELLRGLRARKQRDDVSDLVRVAIRILQGRREVSTLRLIERLIEMPSLADWHNMLRAALHTVRSARRVASIVPLTPREANHVISNEVPANAADLAAIVVGHLRDLGVKIQRASTNDYKQYWNLESRTPRIENDCRDALLSQLSERLGRMAEAGIPAAKEGHVAHEQRADIMVTYGSGARGFCIPIEAKRESYKKDGENVWTALRSQLIERYAQYPQAHGHGVYLVFWFGGAGLPLSPLGTKPRTASELEAQLRSLLLPEDKRIEIVVLDCSLPAS